jgi:tetratricopeptide (TPR) repeat protein
MTTTTAVNGDDGVTRGGAGHRPFPTRVALIVLVALLAGVAIGRAAQTPDTPTPPVASAAVPATAAERVAQYEKATIANPDDARAWQQLAIASVQAVAEGEPLALYNSAADALERAEELAPGDRMNDVAGAYLALARHDFARARTLGTRAHEADPFDPDALAILVDANVELGYYEDATVTVEKLLEIRPSLAAYSRLSYIRELHGNVDGALEAFALAQTAGSGSQSDLAQVASLRGTVAVTHGDPDEAERLFRQARNYSSGTTNEAGMARVLIARGELADAQTLLEAAMQSSPSAAVALLLDEIYVSAGVQSGRAEIARFLDANLADERAAGADVDMEASLIAADHGQWNEALDVAQSAYDRRPENIFTAAALAWALHGNGDDSAAKPLIEKALRLGTRDPVLHYRAAEIFAADGMEDRAAEELATAFEINPHFSLRYRAPACTLGARIGMPCPASA